MLTVLARKPVEFPKPTGTTSLRRRTLGEWITSPKNALSWRVLANRVWQHHFGTGIGIDRKDGTTAMRLGLTRAGEFARKLWTEKGDSLAWDAEK